MHDPGPWTENENKEIVSADGKIVIDAYAGICGRDNYTLMVASPELLAALLPILKWAEDMPYDSIPHDMLDVAKAAIKKAGG